MGNDRTELDLQRHFSREAHTAIHASQLLADERKHSEAEPIHLLSVLSQREDVQELFVALGATTAKITGDIEFVLNKLPTNGRGEASLKKLLGVLAEAEKCARAEVGLNVDSFNDDEVYSVNIIHLLDAISRVKSSASVVLSKNANLKPGALQQNAFLVREDGSAAPAPVEQHKEHTAKPNNTFTRNLIAMARHGKFDPVIGQDDMVRRLMQIVERRTKHHPIIVGEAGVGKFSIVSALATRLANGEVPPHLKDLRMLELNVSALLAGAKQQGQEVERRLAIVFNKAIGHHPAILFVRGIETLLDQPSGDLIKQLLLKSNVRVLASTTPDGLKKIAAKDATVLEEFTRLDIEPATVEQASAILRALAPRYETHHSITIGEESIAAAVRFAKRYLQSRFLPESAIDLLDESASRKRMELDGLPSAVDQAVRKLSGLKAQRDSLSNDADVASVKVLGKLDKEIDALEPQVAEMREKNEQANEEHARVIVATHQRLTEEYAKLTVALSDAQDRKDWGLAGRLEHETMPALRKRLDTAALAMEGLKPVEEKSRVLTENDVAQVLEAWTGIPATSMLEGEVERLKKMEASLRERVVGQEEALAMVAKSIRRSRLGLRDGQKPIGSFLFLGPSGVGKTELARALAAFLFNDETAMVRLDMSEYQEKHMAQRLLGAPPGYVNANEGGLLTSAISKKPYSVILCDEVEKGHPDVLLMFLQILDDARLTSGLGETVDFSNTVVIMTSNIGSKYLLNAPHEKWTTKEGRDELTATVQKQLTEFMRPELINRLDQVALFSRLEADSLRSIVDIQMKNTERLLKDRELSVRLTDTAKNQLVELGSLEPAFGARPIKRLVVKHVQDPIATGLFEGTIQPGGTVQVDFVDGAFTFGKV